MSNVEQFKAITGADDETAKFFLEMAKNDLSSAVANYFEGGAQGGEMGEVQPQQQAPPSGAGRRLGAGGASDYVAPTSTPKATAPSKPAAPTTSSSKKPAAKSTSKFASLSDLNKGEEEDDDENANKYFAGGGKNSGQAIIGAPTGKKKDLEGEEFPNELTEKIFKAAKEKGAKSAEEFERENKKPTTFTGSGNRLGSTPSTSGTQPKPAPKPNAQEQDEQEEEKVITISFWEDGFTIDNGELRKFDDPKNKEFLEAVNKGYVPREVAGNSRNVVVNLVKNQGKYVPPPKVFKAFEGGGRSLGTTPSNAPGTSSTKSKLSPAPAATSTSANSAPKHSCDTNRPHTSIQIRLSDGTRLVANFNLDDTVQSIVNFVKAATPTGSQQQFVLMTTFPRKELTDMKQTIEQAGLKNAALVQNLK